MENTQTTNPDKWVILKLPNNLYKVYGTWYSDYSTGAKWKINSGILKVEQDEDFYYFTGYSGSCYKCRKKKYGVATNYNQIFLDRIIKQAEGKVEVMEDVEDWSIIN
jgi:hypothetical protein